MTFAMILVLALCGLVVYIAFDEGMAVGEMDNWDMGFYGSVMAAMLCICLWAMQIYR